MESLAQAAFLALLDFVRSDALISDVLDGRVFGDKSDSAEFPQVVFMRVQTRRVQTAHGGAPVENLKLRICCAANEQDEAAKIAVLVGDKLQSLHGEYNGLFFDWVEMLEIEHGETADTLNIANVLFNVWIKPLPNVFIHSQLGAWQQIQNEGIEEDIPQ